ncbi:MAG: metal-dependent transcriptional regulator [Acidobacteriota bacterium]
MATQSIEDYIKAIFQLRKGDTSVPTSALAERLAVRPASVSNMLRRLDDLELIRYEPYRGAILTEAGEKLARGMIRRHRLIERFLSEVLDYPWEQVHEEAERLEHAVSPRFVEAIDRLLERPLTDPHGAPIPGVDGEMVEEQLPSLSELEPGEHAVVRRVRDSDPELLKFLRKVGIHPEARIEILDHGAHDGPIVLRIDGESHRMGKKAADSVYVEQVPNPSHRERE